MKDLVEYDDIGYWSEVKLEILRKYAAAYSSIMAARKNPSFFHIYVDAFAGGGMHRSRTSGELVLGSPLAALGVEPPFREYHFIDLEPAKVRSLRSQIPARGDVHVYEGDCNQVLLEEVYPSLGWRSYHRALCLLDPYGLHLDWNVIAAAGGLGTVDLFLNFPVTDMNRNVLWRRPEAASPAQVARLNRFWGDASWRDIVYETKDSLFGEVVEKKHDSNAILAAAFRKRLETSGGFKYVPDPMPMRNKTRAIVYYLFFASQKKVAGRIVEDIFGKYAEWGG